MPSNQLLKDDRGIFAELAGNAQSVCFVASFPARKVSFAGHSVSSAESSTTSSEGGATSFRTNASTSAVNKFEVLTPELTLRLHELSSTNMPEPKVLMILDSHDSNRGRRFY